MPTTNLNILFQSVAKAMSLVFIQVSIYFCFNIHVNQISESLCFRWDNYLLKEGSVSLNVCNEGYMYEVFFQSCESV